MATWEECLREDRERAAMRARAHLYPDEPETEPEPIWWTDPMHGPDPKPEPITCPGCIAGGAHTYRADCADIPF